MPKVRSGLIWDRCLWSSVLRGTSSISDLRIGAPCQTTGAPPGMAATVMAWNISRGVAPASSARRMCTRAPCRLPWVSRMPVMTNSLTAREIAASLREIVQVEIHPSRCLDRAALRRNRARPCHHPQARAHDGRRCDRDERTQAKSQYPRCACRSAWGGSRS